MDYKIYADRLKLFNSYLVSKSDFETELNVIRYMNPTCPIWQRTIGSLRREWASHNLAYFLGICWKKTADVDLNFEQKWYEKLAYFIVGSIALLVIK